MKKYLTICLALLLSTLSFASDNAGQISAVGWAELVDSGAYGESWEKAAPIFQSQVSKAQWEDALNKVRSPLGNLISRDVAEAKAYTSLPGAPDGQYLVVTTKTKFQNNASATETLTVTKVGDAWLIAGYFIK